ncbi:MAG: glycosyltransferase family 4 protein [Chthoniobacterales bacterium]
MGKRLLILTRTFPPSPGAVGHLVKELGTTLSEAGFVVTVIAAGAGDGEKDGGLEVVRVGSLPFSRQSHVKRALSYLSLYPAMLWTAARQRRPDVVITTTDPPLQAVLGWLLKIFFGCKLIHWSQDLYPEMAEEAGVIPKNGALARILRWISTAALKRHDQVVSIGRCMSDRLIARGLNPVRITLIENWTDPQWIHPIDQAVNAFWREQNLSGRFVVLYSGNMGMAHSFSEILDAAETLQTSAPDVLFLFIGDGPRRLEVEEESSLRGLSNIRFLPPQPWTTLPESLGAGDVHVVSLRANLSGLVVPSKFYGGMAAGRACLFIGPEKCEIAQLIAAHRTGKVMPPNDPAKLVAAILDYRDDATLLKGDNERARRLGEGATLENAIRQFLELLSKVSPRPSSINVPSQGVDCR